MNRPRSIVLASIVGVVLIAGAGVGGALATTRVVDGVAASGRVNASAEAFWFGQMTRDGVCRLVTGCLSATGADPNWVFGLQVDVPGLGVQRVDTRVTVVESVVPHRMRLALASDSAAGVLRGELLVTVAPAGVTAANVGVTIVHLEATGPAQASVGQFAEGLQPYLDSQLGALNAQQAAAAARTSLALSAKGAATVRISAPSITRKRTVANGILRVLAGDRVVCTSVVRASIGQCRFAPLRRGTRVTAVVTGLLSTGLPLWTSTTAMSR